MSDCLFWHYWSRWSTPYKKHELYTYQGRTCYDCGLFDERCV